MIYSPIWKDIEFRSSADTLDYIIKDEENKLVHNGYTMRMPDETGITINVNTRLEEYLGPEFESDFRDSVDDVISNQNGFRVFGLLDTSGTTLESYGFLYDWSYEDRWTGQTMYAMTEPINGHIDPRMKSMFTFFNTAQTDFNWTIDYDVFVSISPRSLQYDVNGGVAFISVVANDNWSVTSKPDWVVLDITSGTGSYSAVTSEIISCSVGTNPGDSARTGTIVFTYSEGSVTVYVRQESFATELVVSPSVINASGNASNNELKITANTQWELVSKPDWVTLSTTQGPSGVSTVIATVGQNTGVTRTGYIVFRNVGFANTATCTVNQSQADPYIRISPAYVSHSSDSGTTNISVVTNGSWTITDCSNWFYVDRASGDSTTTGFTITFFENETSASLSGNIVIRHNETSNSYTIPVTQSSARTVGVLDFVYNVTSTTQSTTLYGYGSLDEHNIKFMEVDGGPIENASSAVTFTTTGLHNVRFYLSNDVCYGFGHNNRLVRATLTNVHTLRADCFEWDSNLTAVTFNDEIWSILDVVNSRDMSTSTIPYAPFRYCNALTSFSGSRYNVFLDGQVFAVRGTLVAVTNTFTSFDTSVLPSSIDTIDSYAFDVSNLSTLNINSNILGMRKAALGGTHCTAITMTGATIPYLPTMCFDGTYDMTEFVVGDSVRTIGDYCFADCKVSSTPPASRPGLTAVTFGSSVQQIGKRVDGGFAAGSQATSLKNLVFKSSVPPVMSQEGSGWGTQNYWSFSMTSGGTIHYPVGSDYSSIINSHPFVDYPDRYTFIADVV